MDQPDRRPIGYWLKHLDRLIEETFDRTLGSDGLTRRHWQVLNTLEASRTTTTGLAGALQPFVGEDATAVNTVVDDLAKRGWLRRFDNGDLELSAEGRTAHAAVLKRVGETRQLLRRGISDDQYLAVVAILQRMASNLAAEGAVPPAKP
jgi:DNA-binding MarR family transcriptional regulator